MHLLRNKLLNKRFGKLAALLLTDLVLFTALNANKVPLFMLIVGFILLLLTIYQVIRLALLTLAIYGLKFKHGRKLTIYLTAVFGVMIALKSLGELSARDIVVLIPLAAVAYLYSSYSKQAV